jgi:hypothetical protein
MEHIASAKATQLATRQCESPDEFSLATVDQADSDWWNDREYRNRKNLDYGSDRQLTEELSGRDDLYQVWTLKLLTCFEQGTKRLALKSFWRLLELSTRRLSTSAW